MKRSLHALFLLVLLWAPALLCADQVVVVEVAVEPTGNAAYRFDVTLRHADSGWKHYADQWQVLAPDGSVLGTRVLHHPHVNEQPFTRSLTGVRIPPGIRQVTVRGRDNVHGWGSATRTVVLPDRR